MVHYLNSPCPDDNKLIITPNVSAFYEKKEWTKEDLISQLKPMCKSPPNYFPDTRRVLRIIPSCLHHHQLSPSGTEGFLSRSVHPNLYNQNPYNANPYGPKSVQPNNLKRIVRIWACTDLYYMDFGVRILVIRFWMYGFWCTDLHYTNFGVRI